MCVYIFVFALNNVAVIVYACAHNFGSECRNVKILSFQLHSTCSYLTSSEDILYIDTRMFCWYA